VSIRKWISILLGKGDKKKKFTCSVLRITNGEFNVKLVHYCARFSVEWSSCSLANEFNDTNVYKRKNRMVLLKKLSSLAPI